MRLIDADEAKADIEKFNRPLCDGYHMKDYVLNQIINDIEDQPTVKAIPIEWLLSIMRKQIIFAMESEMEGTTTVKDGVIHCVSGALACQVLANVIELWEKENE